MLERFTDAARPVVVQAREDARRLGHSCIGCEHDQGVTPERIEAEVLDTTGRGHALLRR